MSFTCKMITLTSLFCIITYLSIATWQKGLEQNREKTWTEKVQISSWFYAEEDEQKSVFYQYSKSISYYSDICSDKIFHILSYTVEKTSNISLIVLQFSNHYILESLSSGFAVINYIYITANEYVHSYKVSVIDMINNIKVKIPYIVKDFPESPLTFTFVLVLVFMLYVYLVYFTLSYLLRNVKRKSNTTQKVNHTELNSRQKELYANFKRTQSVKRQQIICWKLVIFITSLFFFISIPWEFIRLYQQGVAEKAAFSIQGIPLECLPKEMTNYEYIKSWFTWQYSWSPNPCEVYHKAVLVDPLWEVTPLMVLSSVLTRCISKPVELLCVTIGRCFRLMFSEIPVQWQPVLMLLVTLITIMSVLMCCRYRIHLPLLFNFEPSKSTPNRVFSKRYPQTPQQLKCIKSSGKQNHSCKETVANVSNNSSFGWNTSGESDCFIVE